MKAFIVLISAVFISGAVQAASFEQLYLELVNLEMTDEFQLSHSKSLGSLQETVDRELEKIAYDFEGASIHALDVVKYDGASDNKAEKQKFVMSHAFLKQAPFFCYSLVSGQGIDFSVSECRVEFLKLVAPFLDRANFEVAVITASGDDWGEFIYQVFVIEDKASKITTVFRMDVVYPL